MKMNQTNQPSLPIPDDPANNPAADMIRHKLDTLYSHEPDAVTETIESSQTPDTHRSKHQKVMLDLAQSGRPFAEVQTAWHEYYVSLNDKEKHEVWQEFYAAQGPKTASNTASVPVQPPTRPLITTAQLDRPRTSGTQSVGDLKSSITTRVQRRTKLSRSQHIKSLAFGLGVGGFTVLLLLFGFFNERIIAPFVTPSRTVSSTPLILDPSSTAVGTEPKLVIPKINVEVPVVYDVKTVDESAVQSGLERGVVHYATTSNPGEQGNGAIFGHSSNNILNRGAYKFAFVLLSRLELDDTFFVEKDGVRYVYKIIDKKIVPPSDVSVLNPIPGKASTMTLITCDPPGTTINRLVVVGEQISPDPLNNPASTAIQTDAQPDILAGNPESLWSRIWSGIF